MILESLDESLDLLCPTCAYPNRATLHFEHRWAMCQQCARRHYPEAWLEWAKRRVLA